MEDSVAGRLAALESAFVLLADLLAERGAVDADELRRLLVAPRPDVPDGPRRGGRRGRDRARARAAGRRGRRLGRLAQARARLIAWTPRVSGGL